MPVAPTDHSAELDRQVAVWADLGHPLPTPTVDALREQLAGLPTPDPDAETSREQVPFVLVVPAAARPAEKAIAQVSLRGRPGTLNQHAGDIDDFEPITAAGVPDADAYLLVDVERGSEFCNVPPEPAVATLADRGRTPLTVAEGIALVSMRTDVLEKNHCFSLAGSRHGDRRVPAIWISKGAPHLGWCFAGAPHTWLGVASAGRRVS